MFSGIKKLFKKFKELKYFAYHDELTGLYNRHYLNTLDTSKYNFVYFIDINNLKKYNRLGHIYGDKHIIYCVNYIRSNYLNTEDCFIRYAGDEFIILSRHPKKIENNTLFCVGESIINCDFKNCLTIADQKMMNIKSKKYINNMKETLNNFLKHIHKNCTDEYGHLQVVISDDERTNKDYYSETPEGIVENYMLNNNLK